MWGYCLRLLFVTAGAYFSTTGQDSSIKLRMKEDQDGAEPAASSVAVSNLLRLAAYSTPDAASKLQDKASRTLAAFSERLDGMPIALTQMCCSAYLLEAGECWCDIAQQQDKFSLWGWGSPKYCSKENLNISKQSSCRIVHWKWCWPRISQDLSLEPFVSFDDHFLASAASMSNLYISRFLRSIWHQCSEPCWKCWL